MSSFRITYVANGLDLKLFQPNPQTRMRVRRELDVEGRYVFLAVGRFYPLKDYPTLINAFYAFHRNRENSCLTAPGASVPLCSSGTTIFPIPLCSGGRAATTCCPKPRLWLVRVHDSRLKVGHGGLRGSPVAVQLCADAGGWIHIRQVSADVGNCRERLAGVMPSAVVDRTAQAFADAIQTVLATGCRSNGRVVLEPLSINAVAGRIRAVYERAILHFHDTRPVKAA